MHIVPQSTVYAILVLLFSVCFTASSPAGPIQDSYHTDHRTTPELLFSPEDQSVPTVPFSAGNIASDYLRRNSATFALPADISNLRIGAARQSLTATHVRFQQHIDGIPVENAEITVSIGRNDGKILRVLNNTYPVAIPPAAAKNMLTGDQALDSAWKHLKVRGKLKNLPNTDLVYLPDGISFRLVFKTRINVTSPNGHWRHFIDAFTGDVISCTDTVVREQSRKQNTAMPDDKSIPLVARKDAMAEFIQTGNVAEKGGGQAVNKTTVDGTALVFDPDPKTTLVNDSLSHTSAPAEFASAYLTRTLRDITEDSGTYYLTGPWVTITNFDDPHIQPTTTANGNWTATRGTNAFTDAMTYFHIDQNQRYIQSLGYTGATGIQYHSILADSDGEGGADNSSYDPNTDRLSFGHGGVPDNEDADVILHEYMHALIFDVIPSWGGGDSGGMGEGFADYWGASYSYSTSNGPAFHPDWFATWDGHNTNWSGRILNSTGIYNYASSYTTHSAAELWSTPLFQSLKILMSNGVPRAEMDTIVLESLFGLGPNLKMRDAAKVVVTTAETLFPTGRHAQVFYSKFLERNILTNFPLSAPELVYPGQGNHVVTGATVAVRWISRLGDTNATFECEYRPDTPYYFDNMENGINGWTTNGWTLTVSRSKTPTHSWWAGCTDEVYEAFLFTPSIAVSNNSVLSFWHAWNLESGYDGAVVEISTNGGGTWSDIGTNSTQNGYTDIIDSAYSSPISGQQAFSGTSVGFVETLIDLAQYGGKTAQIRFHMATDNGAVAPPPNGWWIDNVGIGIPSPWTPAGTASATSGRMLWTAPANPSTGCVMRARHTGSGCESSAWTEGACFTVSADTDSDGLPDTWELSFFGSLTNASASTDNDSDGMTDLQEYRVGVSPQSDTSLLSVDPTPNAVTGDVAVIRWASVANRYYTIQRSTNLIEGFSTIISNVAATPPTNTCSDTMPSGNVGVFYRVLLTP